MLNHIGGRNFVVTQSLKKLKEKEREIALKPTQFRKVGGHKFIDISTLDESNPEIYESIYYKEIPLDDSNMNETLIVTYSPKYKAYQRKIRNQQLSRAISLLEKGEKFKKERRNPNDPARFIKKTSVTENGEIASNDFYELDEDIIHREEMYDGFYAVTTDLDEDVSEIIKINKRRWQVEECFRIMKTEFEARPIYLQREDRIKAHFLICFLALLVYRLLEKKLNNKYTAEETIRTLRNMNLTRIDEYGYIPSYERTKLTDELHELFGFRTDTEIIKKAKMRNIIKQSKEK